MREGGRTEYRRKNRRLLLWGGNRMSVDGVDGARGRQQGERMLNGARGLLASEWSLLNFPLPKNIFCRKESCALSDVRL